MTRRSKYRDTQVQYSSWVPLTNRVRDESNLYVIDEDTGERIPNPLYWAQKPGADGIDAEYEIANPNLLPGSSTFGWEELRSGDTMRTDDWLGAWNRWNGPSPDPLQSLEQWLESRGRPNTLDSVRWYQQAYGGLPYRFGDDGTVTYDPSAQRNEFSYEGKDKLIDRIGPYIPLAIASFGLAANAGMIPGIDGVSAGAAEGATSWTTGLQAAPEAVMGESFGAMLPEYTSNVFGSALGPTVEAAAALAPEAAGLSGMASFAPTVTGAVSGIPGALEALQGIAPMVNGPLGMLTLNSAGEIGPAAMNLANSGTFLPGVEGGSSGWSLTDLFKQSPGSALQTALKGLTGVDVDKGWLELAGKLGAAGLGAVGANKQSDAFSSLAQKYLDLGAPARARLEASYADPNSFLMGPDVQSITKQGADAAARALSTKYGNPALSPGAWGELMDYNTKSQWGQLSNYRNQLAAQGGLGVAPAASFDSRVPQSAGMPYQLGGALLGDLINPPKSELEQMRELVAAFGGMRNRKSLP